METSVLFHNPRCSKSRAALALLEERNLAVEVVRYLDAPPNRATLLELTELLGGDPRTMMRTGDSLFAELALDRPETGSVELIDALLAHPRLMERPILVTGNGARIGRPTERLLEIL